MCMFYLLPEVHDLGVKSPLLTILLSAPSHQNQRARAGRGRPPKPPVWASGFSPRELAQVQVTASTYPESLQSVLPPQGAPQGCVWPGLVSWRKRTEEPPEPPPRTWGDLSQRRGQSLGEGCVGATPGPQEAQAHFWKELEVTSCGRHQGAPAALR